MSSGSCQNDSAMSDLPKSPSIEQSRRTLFRATIVAAVFLALHVLPLFWRPNPLWGVDFLFYLPAPVQALLVLLSVLLFVPGFRRQVRTAAATLPFSLWGRGRRVRITRTLVLILALASFCSLSSARHFLGDGYLLIGKLDADTFQDQYRAPLTFAFIRALHHAGRAFWETAENTYRVYSYASGVLYVLLSFPVASALGKNKREMSIVLAALLTAGYMLLFYGYVENYALYMPGVLLYLFLGLRTLENRMPLYAPALVLGLLLALHQAFTVFGPSLLFLAYRRWRHRQEAALFFKTTATVAALLCVPVSTAALLGLSGFGFEGYLDRMGGRNFLPLFAEPGLHSEYRIFSFAHVLDFVNQQLLAAPVVCMACILLRKRDLRHQPFLLIAAVFPLFSTFIARPEIGVFRDWDVFSLPALPLTLWVATALMARIRAREPLFHSAFLICGTAAFHTLFWVSLNAGAGAAEARFTHLANRLTGISAVNSWMTLAEFHRDQGNTAAALKSYQRSIEADPTNPNRWMTVGKVYREIGQPADAISFFDKAVELQPDIAVSYMNLGAAYSDLGQFAKAIEFTRKAIAIQPDNATAHANLGAIYRKTGQVANAIEHLERAAALQPDQAVTHGNLGAMYREAGKYTRAITALKKAVTIQPEDATDNLNLGVVYCDIGQFDNAIEYLGKALEIDPRYVLAYTNIGNVYKLQRKYPLAIEYFEKALELQTGRAQFQTFLIIGDTYDKMSEFEKAIPYFQKAIRLNPDHGNAHLLLGLAYRALKRCDEARVHFEKTLDLEPNHPQATQIRQWIKGIGE